uniref:Ig-like domain-containing protein n=1 Tax=Oryzias latipes TaxID=8090 RepID=A0A3P9L3H7_ORYLA
MSVSQGIHQSSQHTYTYKVIQPGGEVIAAEGDSLTLNCTFETSDKYAYLFWYKQEVNSYPKYILKRDTYGTNENAPEFKKDRFDAELKDKSVHLQISSAAVTDSAVYYCVLRPTVTGNSKTLYKNSQSTQYSTLSTRGCSKCNLHPHCELMISLTFKAFM